MNKNSLPYTYHSKSTGITTEHDVKISQLFPLTLAAGWMLAPESLVLLGNGAGQNGTFFLLAITVAALLTAICVKLLTDKRLPTGPGRNTAILTRGIHPVLAGTIALSGRLPILLLAATALLVTAGYTFNEVFLYWFPNFGFSFLLLGIILLLNLIHERYTLYAQAFFVLCALFGILVLAVTGLLGAGSPPPEFINKPVEFSALSATGCLLMFLGFETASDSEQQPSGSLLFAALSLIMVVFILWAVVSMQFVSLHRLADSTIPYATAARKILGEPGRMLMGAVIISGACAAVNGLFLITRRTLKMMTEQRLFPGFPGTTLKGRLLPLLFVVIIGILLMTGLAGDEMLEVYLRGALLLWLLHNSVLCLAASRLLSKSGSKPLYGYFCSTTLALACVFLLFNGSQMKELLVFCLSVLAGALAVTGSTALLSRNSSMPPR